MLSVILLLGMTGTLILFVLPVLTKSKTPAIYTQCMTRLRMIEAAMSAYYSENRGQYPADLMGLVPRYLQSDDVFLLPGHKPIAGSWINDAAARAANQMDYIYLGEGFGRDVKNAGPIIIERRSVHRDGKRLVWKGDGSTDKLSLPEILKLLEPLRNTPRLTQEECDAIVAK